MDEVDGPLRAATTGVTGGVSRRYKQHCSYTRSAIKFNLIATDTKAAMDQSSSGMYVLRDGSLLLMPRGSSISYYTMKDSRPL